jgi:hypothetical protein
MASNQLEPTLRTKLLREEGKSQEENRICGEYIERERNYQNEAVKAVERCKVLDFFVANTENQGSLNFGNNILDASRSAAYNELCQAESERRMECR